MNGSLRTKLLTGLILSALLYTGCTPGEDEDDSGGGDPLVTHQLQVSRFTTATLDNARADAIIAEMGPMLQNSDSAGDVACNVAFQRSGDVTTFATGTGAINSEADFLAVNSLPGNVKVVNQINWCGGLAPNIIGCAPVPGNSLVLIRFSVADQEKILWTHEFGHNQGLRHRDGLNNIMHPSIGATRLGVNQSECDAFRTQ